MAEKKTPDKGLVAIAEEFLEMVTRELDPHTSQKGIIEISGNEVTLLTPAHIQFAIYGRGPGKKPPFDAIEEWVNKNNIQFENTTKRGTAFAIQALIGKNGTKNWVPNAPNALLESFNKYFEDYNDRVGKAMVVSVTKITEEIYKRMTPEEHFKF